MSSDDREPLVLTPDMLQDHVRLVDVDSLTEWDSPWDGDVGAAHTYLGTFGQFQLPIVDNGDVIYGQEIVAAEKKGPQFEGRMNVLDVTDLGWPREKVIAAAIGLHRLEALASVDRETMAALLAEVREANPAWVLGAGFDDEDLNDLFAEQAPPPSLDELEKKYGTFEDEDGWATVTIRAPQHVLAQWNEWCKPYDTEAEALEALLDGRVDMPTLDESEGLVDEGAEPPPDDL